MNFSEAWCRSLDLKDFASFPLKMFIQGWGGLDETKAKVGRFHTPTNFGGLEVREFFHVGIMWVIWKGWKCRGLQPGCNPSIKT